MVVPVAEQDGFLIPAAAFAHNRHGDQLGVCAGGCRTRTCDLRGQRRKQVADEHVHPGAEVVEISIIEVTSVGLKGVGR